MLHREARVYFTKGMIQALYHEATSAEHSILESLDETRMQIQESHPNIKRFTEVIEYLKKEDAALIRLADQQLRSNEKKERDARLLAFYGGRELDRTYRECLFYRNYVESTYAISIAKALVGRIDSPKAVRLALVELLYGKKDLR